MSLDPGIASAAAGRPLPSAAIGLLGAIVFGVLVLATAVVHGLALAYPGTDFSSVKVKIRSWWMMAPLVYFPVALSPDLSYGLIALVCYLSLKEYYTLIPTASADRGALAWCYLVIPLHFFWIRADWFPMFAIFIPVYLFLFIPVRQILAGETANFVARTGRICWGVMLFVYCLSHLAYLLTLGELSGGSTGRELLLYLVFLTEMNDVAAFIVGRLLGRRTIAPAVSPNKTVEGFAGALVITTVLAVLMRFLTPFSGPCAAFVGAALSIAGLFGDLTVSAVKRDVGVKDSSDFIPGHGGILDRVDSLTFTAPLFLHFVRYWYTGSSFFLNIH